MCFQWHFRSTSLWTVTTFRERLWSRCRDHASGCTRMDCKLYIYILPMNKTLTIFFKYLLLLLWSLVLQEHNTSFEDSEKKLLSTKVIIEKPNALLNGVTVEPWLENFASRNWLCCEASKLKYLHTLLSLASGECQEQNRFEQEIKSIPIIFDKTDEVSSQGWLGLDARYFSYSCYMFCFGFASWIPTQNLNLLCHSMVATACILRAMNEFSDSSWTSS